MNIQAADTFFNIFGLRREENMSNIEERVGTMSRVNINVSLSLKEQAEFIRKYLVDFDYEWLNVLDEPSGMYVDVSWQSASGMKEVIFIDWSFWIVTYTVNEQDSGNIEVIKKQGDDCYSFVLSYYNGGTYFQSIMERALSN